MKLKGKILNSENEFRNYVINNYKDIIKLIIFDDNLDNVIFFYCFFLDNFFIATKEYGSDKFEFYNCLYQSINTNLNVIYKKEPPKVLRLIKR